jgi:hypothetical protein
MGCASFHASDTLPRLVVEQTDSAHQLHSAPTIVEQTDVLKAEHELSPRSNWQILVWRLRRNRRSTGEWRRLALTNLRQKKAKVEIAMARLYAEGISEIELEQSAYRAVMNFSHFYGIEPGSTDMLKCSNSKDDANIYRVVLSSAGLRGWAEAEVGAPTFVMTLHAVGEDADGNAEIACFNLGGNPVTVRFASDSTVRQFRAHLADKLQVNARSLRLTLPNADLLSESDDDTQVFHLVRAVSATV